MISMDVCLTTTTGVTITTTTMHRHLHHNGSNEFLRVEQHPKCQSDPCYNLGVRKNDERTKEKAILTR